MYVLLESLRLYSNNLDTDQTAPIRVHIYYIMFASIIMTLAVGEMFNANILFCQKY